MALILVLVSGCADSGDLTALPTSSPLTTSTTTEPAPTAMTAPNAETTTTAPETETPSTGRSAESGPVELEISFFDWTETNPPSEEAFVVVQGVGSWTPDLEFGGDGHSFGHFVIGAPGTLLIYPDGYDGKELGVTFVMTDEMISGSAQALTHIEVFDSEVLVYGQAIPDFEQILDR